MKAIEGYEGYYSITRDGRVFSHLTNKFIALRKHPRGYLQVALYKDTIFKGHLVHRLVAKAYLARIDGKDFVNHKNFNKEDNRVDNLEWCTQKENVRHGANAGHYKGGGRKPSLSSYEVNKIRQMYTNGDKQTHLAKQFSVSVSLINLIVKRKRYV